jgi:hypothetical protein
LRGVANAFAGWYAGTTGCSTATLEALLLRERAAARSQLAAGNFGPIPAAPVWRPSSREIAKLEQVRALLLPLDLFAALSPTVLKSYRQRMSAEEPYELRRHPLALRAALVARGGGVLLESAVHKKVSASGTLKERLIHSVVQKADVSQ